MRYPVNRQGLALSVQELGFEVVKHERRLTNRHHLQFEKNMYTSPLQRVFRGLCNRVVDMRIIDHNALHERYSAPKMPSGIVMIDTIEEYLYLNDVIDVVRECKTSETYQIGYDAWQQIKHKGAA